MDCLETAAFPGKSDAEIESLLHMVVVGGGPTGVEYAAELHDFLVEDLLAWYPDLAGKFKISLIEAMPHVLPMFSSKLIEYTESHLANCKVQILNNTAVKKVNAHDIIVSDTKTKEEKSMSYGLLVWATGNTARPVVSDLIKKLPSDVQNQRRGIVVDDYLSVKGASDIFALGDATATKWAPTAQVASGQGRYLAQFLNALALVPDKSPEYMQKLRDELGPFTYRHMGTLAYIGSDRAIADLPWSIHVGGALTYYFWRSAYLSNLFATRNRVLVGFDWLKRVVFGRDISRE